MKTILVVGRDWTFRALLRAQLREEGYEALGFATLAEAADALGASPPPAALVFDTADASTAEFEPQLAVLTARLPVLVVVGAGEELKAGSLRLLRRPLRLEEVAAAVKTLAAG